MSIVSSGSIGFRLPNNRGIASEFGGNKPDKISEYYRTNGPYVKDLTPNKNIPLQGVIKWSDFYGGRVSLLPGICPGHPELPSAVECINLLATNGVPGGCGAVIKGMVPWSSGGRRDGYIWLDLGILAQAGMLQPNTPYTFHATVYCYVGPPASSYSGYVGGYTVPTSDAYGKADTVWEMGRTGGGSGNVRILSGRQTGRGLDYGGGTRQNPGPDANLQKEYTIKFQIADPTILLPYDERKVWRTGAFGRYETMERTGARIGVRTVAERRTNFRSPSIALGWKDIHLTSP